MTEKEFQNVQDAMGGANVSIQESQKFYENWARNYDQDTQKYLFYNNYVKVVSILNGIIPENQRDKIRILDIGAGTGLGATEMKKHGFQHIDALDPSKAMLDVAREKNIYENYFVEFITSSPSSIPENTYDVITGSGIYAKEAHVPSGALYEMIRLVKPGGYVVLAANRNILLESKNYKELEQLMVRLEAAGKWKKVLREVWNAESVQKTTVERIAWCYKVL